jgi:hypothetical protein
MDEKELPKEETPRLVEIDRSDVISVQADEKVKLWETASFAQDWFSDALTESMTRNNIGCRRREILFAVSFLESYLYEWARDEALGRNFEELERYFPTKPRDMRGVKDKWEQVLEKLVRDNKIRAKPVWDQQIWADFDSLVKMRNGLVHAHASRPNTEGLPEDKKPTPGPDVLKELEAGWAKETVANLVRELHKAAETPPPSWLV